MGHLRSVRSVIYIAVCVTVNGVPESRFDYKWISFLVSGEKNLTLEVSHVTGLLKQYIHLAISFIWYEGCRPMIRKLFNFEYNFFQIICKSAA